MPVTMNDVRAILDAEEPSYVRGVALGREALPHLEVLVKGDDLMLAEKATHLAARIGGARAVDVLVQAARRPDPTVRVAAAASAEVLPPGLAEKVLDGLLRDEDTGVRRSAVRSAAVAARLPDGARIRELLEKSSVTEVDASVRKAIRDALNSIRPRPLPRD
jgi:hypothetical protein